ncbi:MAG: autoinducer binding domain-containing protein [Rhizobiaceae bacterium]
MVQFDDTLECINKIQRATTVEQVCAELLAVTSRFGLNALLAGTVPGPDTPLDGQKEHVVLCDWPLGWLQRYVERNYVDHDAVVRHMKRAPGSFRWTDANTQEELDAGSREVIGDASSFDLHDGFAFPVLTLEGTPIMVSLGGPAFECSPEQVSVVSLVSTYAVGRALQLSAIDSRHADKRPLTDREAECLRWAAVGKSEWEISQILGISEHTSEKHLLNAKAKLGAVNRVQAVAEAIRLGYIN